MRRTVEMFLLLAMCSVLCFVVQWAVALRPIRISGSVVEWTTGKPAPRVMVRFRFLNGSPIAGYADSKGRFTITVPKDQCCGVELYASDPQFGPLLHTTFTSVVFVKPGGRYQGVVVPAIPATEISGKVFGKDGKPLVGCEVFALSGNQEYSPGLSIVHSVETNQAGAFSFTQLGADRYFLAAPCFQDRPIGPLPYPLVRQDSSKAWKVRRAWQTALSQPIVLRPGARFDDVALRLADTPQYFIDGRVVYYDVPSSEPDWEYSYELTATPVDPALSAGAASLNGEACDWDGIMGNFHCDFLSPGRYKLAFRLKNISDRSDDQSADAVIEVNATRRAQPKLTVRLGMKGERLRKQVTERDGYIRVIRDCVGDDLSHPSGGLLLTPALLISGSLWGDHCGTGQDWPTKPGAYVIFTTQFDFFSTPHQQEHEMMSLLWQHGVPVTVKEGEVSEAFVTPMTTDDAIRLALESVR